MTEVWSMNSNNPQRIDLKGLHKFKRNKCVSILSFRGVTVHEYQKQICSEEWILKKILLIQQSPLLLRSWVLPLELRRSQSNMCCARGPRASARTCRRCPVARGRDSRARKHRDWRKTMQTSAPPSSSGKSQTQCRRRWSSVGANRRTLGSSRHLAHHTSRHRRHRSSPNVRRRTTRQYY